MSSLFKVWRHALIGFGLAVGLVLSGEAVGGESLAGSGWGVGGGYAEDSSLGPGWTAALSKTWPSNWQGLPTAWEAAAQITGYESVARRDSDGGGRESQQIRLLASDLRVNLLFNHRPEGGFFMANGMALSQVDFGWIRRVEIQGAASAAPALQKGGGSDLALMFNFALGWRWASGLEVRMDVPVYSFAGSLTPVLYPGPAIWVPLNLTLHWRP